MEIKYGANNCMRDAAKPMNTILRRAPPLVDMTKAVCGMQMPAIFKQCLVTRVGRKTVNEDNACMSEMYVDPSTEAIM
jgi:hypothetical protein